MQMSNGMGTDKSISSFALLGNNIFAGTWTYGVYLSTNDGLNWSQTNLNNQNVYNLATLGNNIFAGTSSGVYISTNNGSTWSQTNNKHITALGILGNIIFAGIYNSPAYSGGVYISTNNGANWMQTSLNNQWVYCFTTLGNNIFAGTNNGVYLSTNNGTNWTQSGLTDRYIYSFATRGNFIFAGSEEYMPNYGGVYYSTNNGSSWTQTTINNVTVFSLATYGNNVFSGPAYNGVYQSTNNGTNWFGINQGFNIVSTVRALLITGNYIYAGRVEYSVWRRPLTDFAGIQNISTETPSAFSLSQNYPNPFNPTTTIRYELPRAGVVRLAVYDVMGREVEMLVNERLTAGSYETVWNACLTNGQGTRFASGVYFYRLTTEGYGETKRMLLIK